MSTGSVTAPINSPGRLFVNGAWIEPSSASMIDVINSGTEELFVSVAEAQAEDINRAVAAACDAFGPATERTPRLL